MIRPRRVERLAYPVFVLATLAAGCLGALAVWLDGFEDLGWRVLWTALIVVITTGLLLSASQRVRWRSSPTRPQGPITVHSTER